MTNLPKPEAVPRRIEGGDTSSFDAMARFLLEAVDGRSSIAVLGDSCGIGEDLACRMVADLARRGVLSVPGFGVSDAGGGPAPGSGGGGDHPTPEPEGEDLSVRVERYFQALGRWNFYEVLGIAPDADRKQARAAYFALSKQFHPDRAFGAGAAEVRKKMEVVFRRLTQAYEVLSIAEKRAEYDEYIADQIAVWKMERQLLDAFGERQAPEGESAEPAAGSPVPPEEIPRRSVPPAPATPVTVSSTPPAARPEHDARRRDWRRERAARMLRQTLGPRPPGASSRPPADPACIEDLLARGGIAMEVGNHAEAARLFGEVLGLDPDCRRAAELLEQAQAEATRSLAAGYLRQGRYERMLGDMERARASLTNAVDTDPNNVEARYQLAELLLATRRDLRRALTMAREVIALGGQKARYFAILGELLLLAKETASARESFARAVSMEPENKEYRRRLKACNG